jgi:hypothetical protein
MSMWVRADEHPELLADCDPAGRQGRPDLPEALLAASSMQTWDIVIEVAKVVVFIGSIVALIVGGPIAWIVFAAALLVLADTLLKKAHGTASWFDVGMAALNCIPITKGLTTMAALKDAYAMGGILGTGGHLLGVGGNILASGGRAVNDARAGLVTMWETRSALPALLHAAPFSALGRLSNMATELRYGAASSWTAFGLGVEDGAGIFGRLRSGFTGAANGWGEGRVLFEADAAGGLLPEVVARRWQTSGGYPGQDIWHGDVLAAGTRVEVLHPGITGFAVPEGTMANLGNDSSRISEALQVAPSETGATIAHNYRPEGLVLETHTDVPVASSTVQANTQYGAGGSAQHFIPNLPDRIAAGDITVHGVDGARLPVTVNEGRVSVSVPGGQSIPLHNLDRRVTIPFAQDIKDLTGGVRYVTDFAGFSYQGYRATNQAMEMAR